MKKLIAALLFSIFYIAHTAPWSYPHNFIIRNNTDQIFIVHDSGLSNHKSLVKTIFLDSKGSRYGRSYRLTMEYPLFNKPNELSLNLQKAKRFCKEIPFEVQQDCKYISISNDIERYRLDLKLMRKSKIGKKSGNWCGVWCGRNVLVTNITIHPKSEPYRISLQLTKSKVGGVKWQ